MEASPSRDRESVPDQAVLVLGSGDQSRVLPAAPPPLVHRVLAIFLNDRIAEVHDQLSQKANLCPHRLRRMPLIAGGQQMVARQKEKPFLDARKVRILLFIQHRTPDI